MITGELKSQVDKIWEAFWTGGISNGLTVIEQFTYLLFIRRLDEKQLLQEKKANIVGIELKDVIFTEKQAQIRWSSFKNKDPETLVESVRKAMARAITGKYTTDEGNIPVLSLAPDVEELVSNSLLQTEQGVQLVMDPQMAQGIINNVADSIQNNPDVAAQPILLTSPTSRRHLHKLLSRFIPQLVVLSHNELSSEASVQSVGIVEMNYAS